MASKVIRDNLPRGIEKRGDIDTPLPKRTVERVIDGWILKQKIDDLKKMLDGINEALLLEYGPGSALIVLGLCRATTSEQETVRVSDPEALHHVLGDRFFDLVRETVVYKPESRLIEMAADGDDPLRDSIADCLSVSEKCSVTWRAEK